jgi:hypothetical protein
MTLYLWTTLNHAWATTQFLRSRPDVAPHLAASPPHCHQWAADMQWQ